MMSSRAGRPSAPGSFVSLRRCSSLLRLCKLRRGSASSRCGLSIGARRSMFSCSGPWRSASSQVLRHGEAGKQTLFVLPALLFTGGDGDLPDALWALHRLHRLESERAVGHHFNGLDNLRTLWGDSYFWNALGNMVFYVLTVLVQYVIAFGLALAAERRHPRAQVFPRRVSHAIHAQSCCGKLDGRQVAHGKPLRAPRKFRQMARLGERRFFHRPLDRPDRRSSPWTPGSGFRSW